MSQTCPTCGKPLDATRAPVARVRGTRVVTYCSVACADGGGTGLAAGSETRAPAVAPPPEPAAPVAPPEPPPIVERVVVDKDRERSPSFAPPVAVAQLKLPAEARQTAERAKAVVPLRAETTPSRRGRGRAAFLVILTILFGAGVAFVLIEVLPLGGSEQRGAAAPRPVEPAGSPVEAAPATSGQPAAEAPAARSAQPVDGDALYRAAVAELGVLSKSSSPRVKRLAAQALARTGNAAALTELRGLLGEEQSQLGRIQIAYALARAGDQVALKELRAQLNVERRDVRLDAARSLVQLGDDSGRKTLLAMLPLANYRLGAAGLLARLKDPDGIKALRAEMTKKSSAENVMRAVVALGRAGQSDVQEQLRTIVHDRRYNVGAADALAALGDGAAVEPLTRQLALSAMRVQAALWLRRLDQKVDLAPLALALETGDDASRVSAAEALLVLTGPAKLAERD
ncbi:MAG TPA: HEAT repeat domain-containing protein [Kofleriaceae bacterium]